MDQAVRLIGGVAPSGRIHGDMAAAPATTGVVSGCAEPCCCPAAGAVIPGSSGADSCVGAAGVPPSMRPPTPCASRGPTARRRWLSGTAAVPAPGERSGVTLLPAPPRASGSPGATVVTPPSAIAARDTAPAATNANRRPREARFAVGPGDVVDAEAALRGDRQDGGVRAGRDVVELETLTAPSQPEDATGAGPPGEAADRSAPAERRVAAVRAASAGQPLEPGQEALGGWRRGRFGEHVLQPALRVDLRLALRAGRHVCQHALARVMTELSVDEGGEPVSQVLLCEVSLCRFRP
ncbi:hypothetical protein SGLAM104S_01534 [Streptomyces glaucescens]